MSALKPNKPKSIAQLRLRVLRAPRSRLRSWQVRFTAITPVHGRPTCTGRVVSVTDGLATVKLAVTLADGTVTLAGDAVIDLN